MPARGDERARTEVEQCKPAEQPEKMIVAQYRIIYIIKGVQAEQHGDRKKQNIADHRGNFAVMRCIAHKPQQTVRQSDDHAAVGGGKKLIRLI